MTTEVQSLLDTILMLPDEDRAEIAQRLAESLDDTVDPEIDEVWRAEIRSRVEAYRRGEIELVDGPEAMRQLRERYS